MQMIKHKHINRHTHTCTRTCTHTRTHTYIHMYTCTDAQTNKHADKRMGRFVDQNNITHKFACELTYLGLKQKLSKACFMLNLFIAIH